MKKGRKWPAECGNYGGGGGKGNEQSRLAGKEDGT
jgi:hypothetical protein